MDSALDDIWKEEVDGQVSECSSASKVCEDRVLDREMEREEIAVCVQKLKNNEKPLTVHNPHHFAIRG